MYTLLDDLIRAFLLCFKSINKGQVDNPMPKKMDLTGYRYEVSASDLNKGNNKSCGCLKEQSKRMVRDRLHIVDGTCIEWLGGRGKRSDNNSGCSGVYRKKNGKYTVNIGFKKKSYYLGTFDDLAEATECRLRAERLVYGEFLRAYKVWKKKAIEEPGWEKLNPFVFEVGKVNGSLVIFNSMEGFDT